MLQCVRVATARRQRLSDATTVEIKVESPAPVLLVRNELELAASASQEHTQQPREASEVAAAVLESVISAWWEQRLSGVVESVCEW